MHKFEPKIQVISESYRDRLGLTNFVNASYQLRDCLDFKPNKVLIIGGGIGLESAILRHLGVEVTTLDIDPELKPDVLGSVDDLCMFKDKDFDVVIASHVLEHLPFEYFNAACEEIARVGHYALIYLPFACLVPELKFSVVPLFRKKIRIAIPLFWKNYKFNGEHYWEIGTKGYSLKIIRKELAKNFNIIESYHNPDWCYSYNFKLKSA